MILRIRGSQIEQLSDVLFYKRNIQEIKALKKYAEEFMSINDYLRIRAFNQAYMDVVNLKKVTLYRGTDGKFGEQIRNILNTSPSKSRWKMIDSSLSGYSDDVLIADEYGLDIRGVTIRVSMKGQDIIIHRDFISSLTGRFSTEREWITKGIEKYIDLKDMQFIRLDGTEKLFGLW